MSVIVSEIVYQGMIKRVEDSIRKEFDEVQASHEGHLRGFLVTEAERLGCSQEFIEQLKKDL